MKEYSYNEAKLMLTDIFLNKLNKYELFIEDEIENIYLEVDRIIIHYKVYIRGTLQKLLDKGYFSEFEPPFWSRLWGHKWNFSMRENVKYHSIQVVSDKLYNCEIDIDRANPKYGILEHLWLDVIKSGFKDERIIKDGVNL